MTESEAITAIRNGDDRGMEYLVHHHQARALRLAYQITRDPLAAEDVVADANLALYRAIKSNRYKDAAFEPWFLRVVTNRAISEARRVKVLASLLSRLHFATPATVNPEELVERNAEAELVHQALESVRPKERDALSLRYVLDLEDSAVAEILGCPNRNR